MADPQPNREPKNLVQPDQGKPDANGGSQDATAPTENGPATPNPSAPRPGVDTGGVPNQSMVPSGPHGAPAKNGGRGAGQPHDKSAPESNPSGTSPSNAPTSAGGSALDTPDTSRPPVDTGAVKDPLPESVSEGKNGDTAPSPNSDQSAGQSGDSSSGDSANQPDPEQPDSSNEPDQPDSDSAESDADGDEQALAEQAEQEQELAGGESGGGKTAAGGGEAAEAANTAEGAEAKAIVMNPAAWGAVALSVLLLLMGLLFVIVIIGISGVGTGGSSTSSGGSGSAGGGSANCTKLTGTPKDVINKVALPIAHKIAFKDVTAESVEASNAAHGPTNTNGTSDHQGPPDVRWAADITNGTSPTPEMDKLAKDLAECFKIPWSGSGAISNSKDGFRMQLIYRSMTGGNHFNHVHIGVAKG